MSWLTRRFATLRWRLTLSYVVTAFVALVTLEAAFVLISDIIRINAPLRPASLVVGMQQLAPQVAPYLDLSAPGQTAPDVAAITTWLRAPKNAIVFSDAALATDSSRSFSLIPGTNAALYVLDPMGQVIAARGPTTSGVGQLHGLLSQPAAQAAITAAQHQQTSVDAALRTTADGRTIVAVPILSTGGQVLGELALGADLHVLQRHVILSDLVTLLYSFIPFSLIAGLLGTVVGLLIARGLRQRLATLTTTAAAWGRGDFATVAHDPTPDELGQLAHNLNRMAEQIQTLLQSRQQLVVVEERQRLARELHDSVKQEIFATSMQIAAARALIRRDPSGAEARLDVVEQQVGTALRELTMLIRELRPATLANQGLGPAIQEFGEEWSRRNAIPLRIGFQGECPVPLEVEQALFRVTQEALANIARHSHALHAAIQLNWSEQRLTLTITDDGSGLDMLAATGKGYGLQSMQERMEVLNGTLDIRHPLTGSGTVVEASVPLY